MSLFDGSLAILTHADSEFIDAIGTELGLAGCQLVIIDEDGALAAQVADRLRQQGLAAEAYRTEINERAVQSLTQSVVNKYGVPRILVNLPEGGSRSVLSVELTEEEMRRCIESNLIHAFLWCQSVGRLMIGDASAANHVIVNVTTLSAMGGWPGWLAQSVALGGVHTLTHTLASEWSKQGVRVNALVAGVTETLKEAIEQSHPNRVIERIPIGRLATTQDIANALLYLVHPKSSYVSGEILRVDGGWDSWGRLHTVAPKEG